MTDKSILVKYWQTLYPETPFTRLEEFLSRLTHGDASNDEQDWYKDATLYALYVDLFNTNFDGLIDKLDYLQDLGITCLWLLPILDSPMRDAGFDIKNYDRIRPDLLGMSESASKEEQALAFKGFLKAAHNHHIKVIFDVAINHTSDQNPWFIESQKTIPNQYSDYYIWRDQPDKYLEARLLFKGIEDSNWEKSGNRYYFHRFFSFQPDLNYRNPEVLLAMTRNLLYWQEMGADGFRADAIPYLWKEDHTSCENLDNTHVIVKFFRAVLDYVKPGTLLLAEACQQPKEVVKYLGNSDECHVAYHFPLMPMMFKAIAMQNGTPIKHTLSREVTPEINEENQWMTFLRVHDELSLELVYVSEEDRHYIHSRYCHDPKWDFRLGEGISARLSELMQRNPDKIALSYSLMLTLTGTPVVYYGDEFGKLNDETYYNEQIRLTGKDDTRFLVRGRIDWDQLEADLSDENNFHFRVFELIFGMLNSRKKQKAFGRGDTQFVDIQNHEGHDCPGVLAYYRTYHQEQLLIINNLSDKLVKLKNPIPEKDMAILFPKGMRVEDPDNQIVLEPYGFVWFLVLE
ncbi:MAG: alpha-amylase [Bacteroidetes bacterium HGW-Bacteroidetes-16]|jgi:maltose alpha-D-glucosyltransferase/alpha-amylase|nr:MAG: alpha-amylase [Bacteroidetes bacterium HGW-Bacteroidetes-16]